MIDADIRALERAAAEQPDDPYTLERLDRALIRAGMPSVRDDMVSRFAGALLSACHCPHAFSWIPSIGRAAIILPFWQREPGTGRHFVGRLAAFEVARPSPNDLGLCCRCATVFGASAQVVPADEILHPDRCRYHQLEPEYQGLPPAAWRWDQAQARGSMLTLVSSPQPIRRLIYSRPSEINRQRAVSILCDVEPCRSFLSQWQFGNKLLAEHRYYARDCMLLRMEP